MTLDLHSSQEKFGSFLRATLDVLSQLLELATLHDISKVKMRLRALLDSGKAFISSNLIRLVNVSN